MSETGTTGSDMPAGRGRVNAPGTKKEDWIGQQLRRVYDDALSDSIPQNMLDLLSTLDDDDWTTGGDSQK